MNLIQQHMENVSLEQARLEERMAQLKAEQDETRKLLNNIRRYRKSLNKQYPSSQATLPLAPPGDDEEEEATDEPLDIEELSEEVGTEPLVWGKQSPGYEPPPEDLAEMPWEDPNDVSDVAEARDTQAEVASKPVRRRKAKAVAEEVTGG